MSITYDKIESYVESRESGWQSNLNTLKEALSNKRDKEKLPIYLIKSRIKSNDSIYIKTKRKEISDLNLITDYAGIRLLCLFEQDILEVNRALIKILKEKKYKLLELNVFNWDKDNSDKELIHKEVIKEFPQVDAKPNRKKSGYKSIHYVVSCVDKGVTYYIEIQLRTLLQDVWAELEHSLSYKKGNIHPHISKSFYLLSKQIQANDELMTHLKDVSLKEQFREKYDIIHSGPRKYFEYDKNILPAIFTKAKIRDKYKEYNNFVEKYNPIEDKEKVKCRKARDLYDSLHEAIGVSGEKDSNTKYWLEMENAFLLFCEGKKEDANIIYKQLNEAKDKKGKYLYRNRYVLSFRMGQVYFVSGDTVEALKCFDKSDMILSKHSPSHYENHFRVKVKQALIYWMLGNEYINIALKQIEEAKAIFEKNKDKLKTKNPVQYNVDYSKIINNWGWYLLESYIVAKNKLSEKRIEKEAEISSLNQKKGVKLNSKDQKSIDKSLSQYIKTVDLYRKKTKEAFKILETLLSKNLASSNCYDTAAWCCYTFFLDEGDHSWLMKAKQLCIDGESHENTATFQILSNTLHMSHRYQILTTP